MDQPLDEPDPPSDLPESVVRTVDGLKSGELRSLVEYARARIEYLETSIAEYIEPDEGEEILEVDERDLYTIVIKRQVDETGNEPVRHTPHAFVVTREPEPDGGYHLHWADIGTVADYDPEE